MIEVKVARANGDKLTICIANGLATEMLVHAPRQAGLGAAITVSLPRPLTEAESLLADQHAEVSLACDRR